MSRVILLLGILLSVSASEKCRALALGGGNDYGAYEAGVVIGLISKLGSDAKWDVVTGNGVGAVNALIISQYEKGKEKSDLAPALEDFWSNFDSSKFYKNWVLGWANALLFKSGLYNSANMKETISSLNKGTFERFLSVGSTDLITGSYVVFNSTNLSSDVMTTGVYASASDYGTFPIVEHNNLKLVSGSSQYTVDILHAVTKCEQMGFKDEDIIVDIVLGAGKTIGEIDASNYKTLQVLGRYLTISGYYGSMQAITNAQHFYPKVQFRSIITPSENLPNPLWIYNFSKSQLQTMIELGKADAEASTLIYS